MVVVVVAVMLVVVVDDVVGLLEDGRHGSYGLDGVLPRRRLAAEHHAVRPVQYRRAHVRHLRASGAGVLLGGLSASRT